MATLRRVAAPALILFLTVLSACGDDSTQGTESQESSSPAASASSAASATAGAGAGGANTVEVVTAANAFLETLSDEERDSALFDFDDEVKKTGWSNFPTSFVARNGLALGDLTDEQAAAELAVMEAALSEQGYDRLVGIREADAYLNANRSSSGETDSGGPGGGALNFGADLYYLAFFGEPSETEQFMVQFGGHHLAYNLTYAGANVSLTPSLTAIEPSQFDYEGQSYDPLADEKESIFAALGSLTEEQLAAAELGENYDDLLLGPGIDGPFPDPEGVVVSDLTQEGQDAVTAAVRAWVGDIDEEAAEALIAQYASAYDETYIGWAGGTTLDDTETYVRIDGPAVWIEFSNQAGIEVEGVHQHTIVRDQSADYGGSAAG